MASPTGGESQIKKFNKPGPFSRATLASSGRWLLHVAKEQTAMTRSGFIRFSITAFAIVIQDERNSPVYRARDCILIDPESPVHTGDDVVPSSVTDFDTQEEPHVIPGHLGKFSEATWSLKQYANGYERSFSRRQFPSAWKIASRFMRG
jgi:hypothetical protein